MDRRLIAARGAATAIWFAALAEAATVQIEAAKYWAEIGRLFASADTASEQLAAVGTALIFIIQVLAPLGEVGSLAVAVWIAGDIWVKWASVETVRGAAG